MSVLLLGLTILIGIHLLPSFRPFHAGLIQRMGEKVYKLTFSIIAFIGLALIIIGKGNTPYILIWQPPAWGRDIPYIFMPFAIILITAAYLPSNIRRFCRHPMLLGVTLWATAHLIANGDLTSITIFSSIGIFALFDMVSSNIRGAKSSDKRISIYRELTVILIGLAGYFIILTIHPAWPGFQML